MDWLFVAIGGACGALSRYIVGSTVQNLDKSMSFPFGTLIVNLVGCLIIGMYFGFHAKGLPDQLRLLLVVGFLGGFTTFSSFGFETLELIRGGSLNLALINVFVQCSTGIGLVWVGSRIARLVWP